MVRQNTVYLCPTDMVPRPRLERELSESKSDVLTITPSGNGCYSFHSKNVFRASWSFMNSRKQSIEQKK